MKIFLIFENIRTDVNILNWDFSYSERIMVGIRNFQPKKRESVSRRDWDGSTV